MAFCKEKSLGRGLQFLRWDIFSIFDLHLIDMSIEHHSAFYYSTIDSTLLEVLVIYIALQRSDYFA